MVLLLAGVILFQRMARTDVYVNYGNEKKESGLDIRFTKADMQQWRLFKLNTTVLESKVTLDRGGALCLIVAALREH